MVQLTNHAEKRLKERNGLNKKSMQRIADRAYDKGVPRKKTKGRLRKWIDKAYYKTETPMDVKLYGDKLYIFTADGNKALVTVLFVPQDLMKDADKMIV